MSITLQDLVRAQKQIQALFLRPVRLPGPHEVPPWLKEWYIRFGTLPPSQQPDAYRFGLKYLEGVAVHWPQDPRLDVYLTIPPPPAFPQFLASLFDAVPLRLAITGHFNFLQGIGSKISLEDPVGIGVIGLFLNGAGGSQYALTCAHVLDENPAGQTVDSGSSEIGVLSFRVPISTAPLVNPAAPDPVAPNQVDCALAQLELANRTNALPGGLGNVNGLFTVSQGANVRIVNELKSVPATVVTTSADLRVPYHLGWAYFDDLIATTGEDDIEPGDSGSLVISPGNLASGLVMAISGHARTYDHPPQNLGPIVVVSGIQKIIDNLTALTGAGLTLA
jgi:hypothetical protein